jgi:hypothetical protein
MESSQIKNKEDTLKLLQANGVTIHHTEDHEKLDTVQLGLEKFKCLKLSSGEFLFVKNLFLKSKAGGLYLITLHPVRLLNLGNCSQLQKFRKNSKSQKRLSSSS